MHYLSNLKPKIADRHNSNV